ncbi:MAG: hypothetical protein RCG15_01210 [Candidatus Rickettsia vulgarisii]
MFVDLKDYLTDDTELPPSEQKSPNINENNDWLVVSGDSAS